MIVSIHELASFVFILVDYARNTREIYSLIYPLTSLISFYLEYIL